MCHTGISFILWHRFHRKQHTEHVLMSFALSFKAIETRGQPHGITKVDISRSLSLKEPTFFNTRKNTMSSTLTNIFRGSYYFLKNNVLDTLYTTHTDTTSKQLYFERKIRKHMKLAIIHVKPVYFY